MINLISESMKLYIRNKMKASKMQYNLFQFKFYEILAANKLTETGKMSCYNSTLQ